MIGIAAALAAVGAISHSRPALGDQPNTYVENANGDYQAVPLPVSGDMLGKGQILAIPSLAGGDPSQPVALTTDPYNIGDTHSGRRYTQVGGWYCIDASGGQVWHP
jgi:hypothetical protein